MSLGQDIKIDSDRRTQVEAETIKAGFLDQGFINTMRFSELNGLEETDNSFLWMVWHGYIECGLQQMVEYNEWIIRELEVLYAPDSSQSLAQQTTMIKLPYLKILLDSDGVKKTIPYDQRARIYRYFESLNSVYQFLGENTGVPLDSEKVMWLIRTYLADWNQNLVDGVILFDGHYAILNGRMARAKGHMKDLLKVTENHKQRDREIRMGKPVKEHWWSRESGEEENG